MSERAIKRIVVGMDGSAGASEALSWAISLARVHGAEIVAVHAISVMGLSTDPLGIASVPGFDEARDAARALFEKEWCEPMRNANIPHRMVTLDGGAAGAIKTVADRENADLIVVGTRGHGGFSELLLGSVGHQLAHHARRPLLVVPIK